MEDGRFGGVYEKLKEFHTDRGCRRKCGHLPRYHLNGLCEASNDSLAFTLQNLKAQFNFLMFKLRKSVLRSNFWKVGYCGGLAVNRVYFAWPFFLPTLGLI